MPWMETSPMEQRERFIHDYRLDLYTMVEHCTRYGISRKTGSSRPRRLQSSRWPSPPA